MGTDLNSSVSSLMNTYARLPVVFVRGQGVWLWDDQGRQYFDALAGIAVNTLGHGHTEFVQSVSAQLGRLSHVSNLYHIQEQAQAAQAVCELAQMDRAFFCNSGCEANEAAIKLARLHGHRRGIAQPKVVVMERAFHGRTLATLSATGNTKVQQGFEPLVEGFIRVPYGDLAALAALQQDPDIVAVLLEVIQGEGGIYAVDATYLEGLREICNRHQWLMMLDEVQCGVGRTGHWFAYQASGVLPDVITLAKGLGAGIPVGACLARGAAAEVFAPGNHGSTFGGNPLACCAVLTTLRLVQQHGLLENAAARGMQLRQGLIQALADVPGVQCVRGAGLMLGVQLDRPCSALVTRALDAGLLINVTAESVVRLLPALIISSDEIDELIVRLAKVIREFYVSQ